MDFPGKVDSVEPTRHIDVGQEHAHFRMPVKLGQRLLSVPRLDHLEAGILQHLGPEHAHERLVLYEENDWANVPDLASHVAATG